MASNMQVTPLGTFCFGALITPRINNMNPDAPPEWLAALQCSEAESQAMFEAIEAALEDARAKQPRFPKDSKGLRFPWRQATEKAEGSDERVPLEGQLLWVFKRKSIVKRYGEEVKNTPPTLYDNGGKVCTGQVEEIGLRSTGKVIYRTYAYCQPGNSGVGFGLEGFQIGELKESNNTPDLPPIGGNFNSDQEETVDLGNVFV